MNELQQFLENFRALGDRELQSEYLIELASRFRDVSSEIASRPFEESHKVPACESEAYIWVTKDSLGLPVFHFAIENPQGISAKALAVILTESLSHHTSEQIASVDPEFIYGIFGSGMTMGRGQGLMGMVRMAQRLAKTA